ncbi:MAG TPA: MFS transporter, partial [Candidatus Saccharimonadia bacterium]|nr:MFS transporter [Candidatus Saccharimonadia bacterium]
RRRADAPSRAARMIGRSSMTVGRETRARGTTAFRHRNYRVFFVGQAVSLVGTWMQQVAQAWLVLELTGDPIWLGIVAAAQFIPVMILGLFAGVAADALPKRQTLVATQAAMMSLAIVLAALTISGVVQVWMILVLAILLGCANAVDMPVRQAFAIELVGREDVGNAVALNSAMFNGSRIVGPALAGLTIAAFGVGTAFVVNALSFLAVIVALLMLDVTTLRTPPRIARPTTAGQVIENLAEGLRYVRHTPLVLLAVLVVGGVGTFGMNFSVLIPAFAADDLASGAAGYGFLMAASGVGSLIAALALAFRGKPHSSRIATGAIILGIASVAMAALSSYASAVILMVLIGYGGISMAATANATIQLAVPDDLRGRVMSVYTTIFASSAPVGGLLMGAIASGFGPAVAIGVGGVLSGFVGVAAALWLRAQRQAAMSVPAIA